MILSEFEQKRVQIQWIWNVNENVKRRLEHKELNKLLFFQKNFDIETLGIIQIACHIIKILKIFKIYDILLLSIICDFLPSLEWLNLFNYLNIFFKTTNRLLWKHKNMCDKIGSSLVKYLLLIHVRIFFRIICQCTPTPICVDFSKFTMSHEIRLKFILLLENIMPFIFPVFFPVTSSCNL